MDNEEIETQKNTVVTILPETKDGFPDNTKEHMKSISEVIIPEYMYITNTNNKEYGPIYDDYVVTYSSEEQSFLGCTVNIEKNGQQQPDVCFKHEQFNNISFIQSTALYKKLLSLCYCVKYESDDILFKHCLIDLSSKRLLELKHPHSSDYHGRFECTTGFLPNGDLIQVLINHRKIYKYCKPKNTDFWEYSQVYKIEIPESLNDRFNDIRCSFCQTKLFLFVIDHKISILQFDLLKMTLDRQYKSDGTGLDYWCSPKVIMNKNQTLMATDFSSHTWIFSMENAKLILKYSGGSEERFNHPVEFITLKNGEERLIIMSFKEKGVNYKFIDPYKPSDEIDITDDVDGIGYGHNKKVITKLNRMLSIDENGHCITDGGLDENKFQPTYSNSIYTLSTFKIIQGMLKDITKEDFDNVIPENGIEINHDGYLYKFDRCENHGVHIKLFKDNVRTFGYIEYNVLSLKLLNNQDFILIYPRRGIEIFTIGEDHYLKTRYLWYNDEWNNIYEKFGKDHDNVINEYKPLINKILDDEFNDLKSTIPLPKFITEGEISIVKEIVNDKLGLSLFGFEMLKIANNKLDKDNNGIIGTLAKGIADDSVEFSKFGVEVLKVAIKKKCDNDVIQHIIDKILESIQDNTENSNYMTLLHITGLNLPELCHYYSDFLIKYISCTSITLSPYCDSIKRSTNTSLHSYSNIYIKKSSMSNDYFKFISSLYKKVIQYFPHSKLQEEIQTISFIVPFPQICIYQDENKNNHLNDNENNHKTKDDHNTKKNDHETKDNHKTKTKPKIAPWNEFLYKPKSILFCNIDSNHFYNWLNFAAIIDFKWKTYGRIYYYLIWSFYTIFYICYALASTLDKTFITDSQRRSLYIIPIIFGFIHLYFELQQCIWKPKEYFNDLWNYFDVGAYSLPIITSINWVIDENPPHWIMAISFILLSFKFLLFFRVIKSYGIYFAIIIGVAKTVFPFLVVLFFIVLGFAHAFFIILRSTSANDDNDPLNLATRYYFTDSDGNILNNNTILIQPPDSNTNLFNWFPTSLLAVYNIITGDSGSLSSWTFRENPTMTILLVVFTFFTVIYLMNLFIGLLNLAIDDYKKEEEFLLQKAQIIMEIELFYMLPYQKCNKEWFPDWIFYDMPVTEVRKLINAIDNDKTEFNYYLPFISDKLRELVVIKDEVREKNSNEFKQQIDEVKQQNNELKQQNNDLKQQMKDIQELLNSIVQTNNTIDKNDKKDDSN